MLDVIKLNLQLGEFSLKDITLTIDQGEYLVLMGSTGSGKSLLIKCITGLARCNGGTIYINKKRIDRLSPRLRNIGYVPQESNLFPHMTVLDNILFPIRVRKAKYPVDDIISMLNLEHLLHRSPKSLSGGERQKTALARALATKPKLLVLDEPVSAVDEPTRREICKDLRKVQRKYNLATIHVCHSLDEAKCVSDHVGIMQNGRIIQKGTIDEISQNPASSEVSRLFNLD